jgi:hypothetical protein
MKMCRRKSGGFAVSSKKNNRPDSSCFSKSKKKIVYAAGMTITLLLVGAVLYAQDGNAGLIEANSKVRSYFDNGTKLMYAVGAIVGLIGAVKVYNKWNSGDPDTGRVAASWFGSCVFLVIVATVIRSFFGIV